MKKIIDVRFRPPVGNYLKLKMYQDKATTAEMGRTFPLAESVVKESLDLLLQEMESVGDYIGCVVGVRQGSGPEVGNAEIYQLVSRHPHRFIGIGGIDLGDRHKAFDEIDKCVNEYGFKAIIMEPASYRTPMYMDDRRLYPLYARCADMGLPVFVLIGGQAGPDVSYSNPVHIDHVATEMPELKIVVTHGAWPWVTQMIQVARRRHNIYLSADIHLPFPGGDQYVDAVNVYLGDRFCYGTAYPFTPLLPYYEKFKGMGIREELVDKVLYKNIASLLKL
jgi:predicted TIM-barrel fold metal-dependent hydrolase